MLWGPRRAIRQYMRSRLSGKDRKPWMTAEKAVRHTNYLRILYYVVALNACGMSFCYAIYTKVNLETGEREWMTLAEQRETSNNPFKRVAITARPRRELLMSELDILQREEKEQ